MGVPYWRLLALIGSYYADRSAGAALGAATGFSIGLQTQCCPCLACLVISAALCVFIAQNGPHTSTATMSGLFPFAIPVNRAAKHVRGVLVKFASRSRAGPSMCRIPCCIFSSSDLTSWNIVRTANSLVAVIKRAASVEILSISARRLSLSLGCSDTTIVL